MPRNSSGQYELPNPPFQSGSIISSLAMNQMFADVAAALSESLSRTGAGGMAAPLKLPDGSAATPSLTFNLESTLGLYRSGNGAMRLVGSAATLQEWALTYVNINVPLTVTSTAQNTTAVTATGNGTGNGGTFTGGTPTGNANGGSGLVATGGAGAGTGVGGAGLVATGGAGATGGVGILATGAGGQHALRGSGGIDITLSPLGIHASAVAPTAIAQMPMPNTAGQDYASVALTRTRIPVANYDQSMNVRLQSKAAVVTGFGDVRLVLSGDVGGTVALLGQFALDSDAPMISRSVGSPSSTSAANPALALTNGGLRLDGVAPASGIGVKNQLTSANTPKAWAVIGVLGAAAGNPPDINFSTGLYENFNISNVTGGADGRITVTFATPFLNSNYSATITVEKIGDLSTILLMPKIVGRTSSTLIFRCVTTSGGAPSNYIFTDTTDRIGFHINVIGRQ